MKSLSRAGPRPTPGWFFSKVRSSKPLSTKNGKRSPTRRNCRPRLFRPWRGRCDTRPSGQVTGSVGQPPETLALAAVLRLPATPHTLLSPNMPSHRSAPSGRPCRSPCSGPVAVDLFLSFLTKSSLLCCICSYSCYSTRSPSGPPPRNRPCCASCYCSVLGPGRP